MLRINDFVDYTIDDIPEKYYGKTYTYFSFEVLNDEPILLHLGTTTDNGVEEAMVIAGIYAPSKEITNFLKTITIDNTNAYHPLSLDLKLAKERFGVDIPVVRR